MDAFNGFAGIMGLALAAGMVKPKLRKQEDNKAEMVVSDGNKLH